MLVSELESRFSGANNRTIEVDLADISIADDASSLSIGSDLFLLDEIAEKSLSKYLKVPHNYVKLCDPEFKAYTLRHWVDKFSEVTTQFDTQNGQIVAIHSPDEVTIPTGRVVDVVTRLFEPDDEVRLSQGSDLLHIDVVTSTDYQVDVPNPNDVKFRPLVGDITRGGVRFLSYPYQMKAPVVSAYLERLVCTNGMCTEERLGRVNIKGTTVDDVIEEMEAAAHRILGGLDGALERYAATAQMPIPGSLAAFAHALAREYNLTRAVLDQVMAIINQLPADTATVYDILQAFTAVSNRDVPYATRTRLQTLGGNLALDAERITARCGSCEQLLP